MPTKEKHSLQSLCARIVLGVDKERRKDKVPGLKDLTGEGCPWVKDLTGRTKLLPIELSSCIRLNSNLQPVVHISI